MPPLPQPKTSSSRGPYTPTLILHGGAGAISRQNLPPELYEKYHASLLAYLTSTKDLLEAGGTAVDAACHAVSLMEDDPLFNCGHGSVFTTAGEIEMEASLAVACIDESVEYEGKIKRSAAVSMVKRTRHPIFLAREVLKMGDEDGGFGGTDEMHGHLSGGDVEQWGWDRGLERKERDWFWTERRWLEHLRGLKKEGLKRHHLESCESEAELSSSYQDSKHRAFDSDHSIELPSQGTVGAVCMDSWGVVATATSTGGLTNKRPGRIGDTPTVGAGFWAESWTEQLKKENCTFPSISSAASFSEKIAASLRLEIGFWMGDCLGSMEPVRSDESDSLISQHAEGQKTIEKQPVMAEKPNMLYLNQAMVRKRAVAMSGTGNGDSFLRTNACRTAAAILRFSAAHPLLADGVTTVAGPGGELQKSAGNRWGNTGEGQGGIIGIEVIDDGENKEGRTVFDFNCGGLWRAYYEIDKHGNEKPCVMVFREEY